MVDEIQRLPALLNEVHRFIEDRGLRFVLLGSSARKLKHAGTNLLAGRALHRQMFPLVPQELGGDFDLGHVLRYGSLPVSAARSSRAGSASCFGPMASLRVVPVTPSTGSDIGHRPRGRSRSTS